MDALVLTVVALGVYRVTRLVIEDSIFDRPRDWLISKGWTAIECAWCVSVYVGLVATIVLYATEALALPGVVWLSLPFAFSAIAGLLSSWE